MPPRIVESDYEDEEADELDEYVPEPASGAAGSSRRAGSAKSGSQPANARSSTRIKVTAPAIPAFQAAPSVAAARPARQAAIKANESMDIDGSGDEDDEEIDELEDQDGEADEYAEDDEEDILAGDDDEDAELDAEDASVIPSEAASTYSQTPSVKLKLKFGNKSTTSLPAPGVIGLKRGRGIASGSSSPALSVSATKTGRKSKAIIPPGVARAKRKRPNEAEDDDENIIRTLPEDEDDEEDFLSDASDAQSDVSLSKMTARQRAAHIGEDTQFMTLPDAPSRKKHLTEDEAAMRKVETSRRRKHLLNKKLEEEKQETIERLLKKPIGRKSGASTSRIAAQTKVERQPATLPIATGAGVDEDGKIIPPEQMHAVLPTTFRWISSIKDGVYRELWGVPLNLENRLAWPEGTGIVGTNGQGPQIIYPPPRPPPKSRMIRTQ